MCINFEMMGFIGKLLAAGIFVAKTALLVWVMMWIRWTVPRLRVDQVMGFAWKFLLPLSLINIFVTALEKLFLPSLPWWLIFINLAITGVLILAWSRLYKVGGGRDEV